MPNNHCEPLSECLLQALRLECQQRRECPPPARSGAACGHLAARCMTDCYTGYAAPAMLHYREAALRPQRRQCRHSWQHLHLTAPQLAED